MTVGRTLFVVAFLLVLTSSGCAQMSDRLVESHLKRTGYIEDPPVGGGGVI